MTEKAPSSGVVGSGRRTRGIHSLAVRDEPRLATPVVGDVRGAEFVSRAEDSDRDGTDRVATEDQIDAFLDADFDHSQDAPEQGRPTSRIALLVLVPLAVAILLFVALRSSSDSESPTAEVAGANELPAPTLPDVSDRVLPVDATEIEIIHQTLPPDGGLYSVVVQIRNSSDIALPVSTLTIEIEAFGVRIDPLDVRYDNQLLAAGGTIEAAVRAEIPADSEPDLIVSFNGSEISRVDLD